MRWILCATLVALCGCDDRPNPNQNDSRDDATPLTDMALDARTADAQPGFDAMPDARTLDANLEANLDATLPDAEADARADDGLRIDQGPAVDRGPDACAPTCGEAECGSDGCGGDCGACEGLCEDGRCALPPDGILISELLASNPAGPDWIELQTEAVRLST